MDTPIDVDALDLHDLVPFGRALGIARLDESQSGAVRLPWSTAASVAGPGSPLAPGAVFTGFDQAMGEAVFETLGRRRMTATIELRVDWVRALPADAGVEIRARALPWAGGPVTVQAVATLPGQEAPVAVASGRFAAGAAPGDASGRISGTRQMLAMLMGLCDRVEAERPRFGDYGRMLGLSFDGSDATLPGNPRLIGAPMLPALHGGAVASALIAAADVALAAQPDRRLGALTVQYPRAARLAPVATRAVVHKQGSAASFVGATATQEDGARTVASALMSWCSGAC